MSLIGDYLNCSTIGQYKHVITSSVNMPLKLYTNVI